MKQGYRILFAGLALIAALKAQAADPVIVPGNLNQVYIPDGYDSNDHVQIAGIGILPNTCYKPAYTEWRLVNGTDIYLNPTVYFYDGYCMMMISYNYVSFEIGLLPPGSYNVFLEKTGDRIGRFTVRQAQSDNADDYLYAPISQAYYERQGRRNLVRLSGEFSNSCLRIKEVRTSVNENVVVVLPISEMIHRRDCHDGHFAFERSVDIGRMDAGRYLIHVRSLNGKSVNNIVEVR